MNKFKIDIIDEKKDKIKSLIIIRTMTTMYTLFLLGLALIIDSWYVLIYFAPLIIVLFIENTLLRDIRGDKE